MRGPRRSREVRPAGVERFAHLGDELEEPRLLARRAVRGCGRSIGTTALIRPGRADITTTRVERNTASEIECVTKITVDSVSSHSRSSSRFSRSRVISSSAPNGSSISSSAGENESARAIDTRCCIPPESCHG